MADDWQPISTAPKDGTWIRGRAVNPMPNGRYIEVVVRWAAHEEVNGCRGTLAAWTADDGKYGYAIGSWKRMMS